MCSGLAETHPLLNTSAARAGTIPEGRDGDAYVFRVVFHDWDDDATVRILRAVLQAVGKRAVTLLIVEVGSPSRQESRADR